MGGLWKVNQLLGARSGETPSGRKIEKWNPLLGSASLNLVHFFALLFVRRRPEGRVFSFSSCVTVGVVTIQQREQLKIVRLVDIPYKADVMRLLVICMTRSLHPAMPHSMDMWC